MALTKLKRAFIAAYCEDPKRGQTQAAILAGASRKRAHVTASEWMHDPEVKLELKRQLNNRIDVIAGRIKSKNVTKESIYEQLDEVAEICTQAGTAGDRQTLVRIIELKAKIAGLLKDKVEIGLDDKLMERLEAGRKRAGIEQPKLPPESGPVIDGGGAIQ